MLQRILRFAVVMFFIHSSIHNVNSFPMNARANSSELYVFGGQNGGGYMSSASKLDGFTGRWKSINTMPVAKIQYCGSVVGNKIYIFGGFATNSTGLIPLNEAHVYDTSTDTYTFLQPLPEARGACSAAVIGDIIYVAGGEKERVDLASVYAYNIQTDQWSTVSSMNIPRRSLQLISLNDRLYAIGRRSNAQSCEMINVEIYNPVTDKWTFGPCTNSRHFDFGATVHEGKIYILGGYYKDGLEVYSPENNHWSKLTSPENFDYQYQALASMNGKLWILGGYYWTKHDLHYTKSVFTYDPSTGKWTKEQDMDVPRLYYSSFVVNQ